MSKRAPSTTQLLVITAFALACFGILLFLWVTFGGPTPFKAKSYQIKVPFTEEKWVEATEAKPGNPALVHHFAVSLVQAVLVTDRSRTSSGPDAPAVIAGPMRDPAVSGPPPDDRNYQLQLEIPSGIWGVPVRP